MQENYFPCMTVLYHNVSRNARFSGTIIKYNLTRRHLTKVRKPATPPPPHPPEFGEGVPGSYTLGSAQTIFIFKKQDRNAAISIPPTPYVFCNTKLPHPACAETPRHAFQNKTPHPHIFSAIVRPFLLLKCP